MGVDAFFVVSGFLITSLLLRERETTGVISLPGFWSRRARRLLSASCLVVVVTLIAGRSMLDPLRYKDLAHDALAASLFVVNFVFGHRGADYLQANKPPSPLLHFWSLAVEEQFYLVWPLITFGVCRSRQFRRAMGTAVVVIGSASFLIGIWYTNHQPARAYYYPWNRVWELLAGAGLAVAGAAVLRIPQAARALMGWLGLGAVVVAALAFDAHTKFPGFTALLPVLGTAAVIAAGGSAARTGPVMLLRARPLQWIGARSYAIYLWHWPALVLAEAKWGPLKAPQRVLVILVSIVFAAISYVLVEDPVRRSKWLSFDPRRGLALGATLVVAGSLAAVFALTLRQDLTGGGDAAVPTLVPATNVAPDNTTPSGDSTPDSTTATSPPPIESLTDLIARNTPLLEQALATTAVPANLSPSLSGAGNDLPAIYDDGCLLNSGTTTSPECVYGDPTSATTVVLVGDSHAAQWFPAVENAAKRRSWRLVVLTKKGCPAAEFTTYGEGNQERTECGPWRQKVADRLAQEKPALVIVASYRYRLASGTDSADNAQVWRTALSATYHVLRPLTAKMLVLSDTPNPTGDIPSCVAGNLRKVTKCLRNRAEADRAGLLQAERDAAKANDAAFVTTSDWLCGASACPVILGNILMYRDDNHITATAATYFTPFIEAAAAPLLAG